MFVLKLLFALAVFCVPAVAAGSVARKLAAKSHGVWKVLAWVPVLPLAVWGPWIAWEVTRDRTSHNLWPFELVMVGAVSLVLLAIFLVARRFLGHAPEDFRASRRGR